MRKGKGCDIGHALAMNSCEGAHSVETRTVTALDAITAFAVPNPNYSSQSRRFFQVWSPGGSPRPADHSVYFGLAHFIVPTLSTVDGSNLNRAVIKVNANFWCNAYPQRCEKPEAQIAVRGNLTLSYYQFTRLLHIKLHKRVPIGKR